VLEDGRLIALETPAALRASSEPAVRTLIDAAAL
jgi:hypothetical protein